MRVFAIADLHLSFGIPDKGMEIFGPVWKGWTQKLEDNWKRDIQQEDLVLIPGDISWAMRPEEAEKDLLWIDSLPGKKVLLKGNHDYWWGSLSKVKKILPQSIQVIQNNALLFDQIAVGGARLWDTPEFSFSQWSQFRPNPRENTLTERQENPDEMEKIFLRELQRLKLSLDQMDSRAKIRIALTHYPPIGGLLEESRASQILESYNINFCVFGHLHNLQPGSKLFGEKNGISYHLVSADWLDFSPLFITK